MIIVQALVTALLSGMFSGAVIFALNERRDRANLILGKAEEATESFQLAVEIMSKWPLAHYDLFTGGDMKAADAAIAVMLSEGRGAMMRAKVLIDIYLPNITNPVGDLTVTYASFIKPGRDLRMAAIQGKPIPEELRVAIDAAGPAIVKAGSAGLETLLRACKERANAPHLVRFPRRS